MIKAEYSFFDELNLELLSCFRMENYRLKIYFNQKKEFFFKLI